MKIGFDTGALHINPAKFRAGDADNMNSLFSSLSASGHEIFVFEPSEADPDAARQMKTRFLRICFKSGVPAFRFAVIAGQDLAGAAQRNHIDIFVTADSAVSGQITAPTECILTKGLTADQIQDRIAAIIRQNREPVLAADAAPAGLPSADRLWMKHYRKGDLKWQQGNLSPYDRLVVSNQDWHDETAMEFFGTKISHGEFLRRIDETADQMYADGIRKGMRVPLILVNTPESLIVLYALYRLKATVTPIFPLSTKEDMQNKLRMIQQQNSANGFPESRIFLSDLVFGRFRDILPENGKVIALDITASMPGPMAFAFRHILAPKMGVKPVQYSERVISFRQYTASKAPHHNLDTSFDDTYTAVQLYTGGTVKPKGVMLTESSIDSASRQFYNDRFAFRRGDKIAAFMPLNHSFGLIIGTHVALTLGVNLDIIMKINFKRLDKLFLKDRVNLFGGIPNMFPAIRNNEHFRNADLSHVKYILSGGSLIDRTEKERTTAFFQAHHSQAEVHDGYGLTESAGGIIYDGVPNIGTDVKIVENGTEQELGYEETGELCMSGAQIMRGYDETELTGKVLRRHADGKLWLHTGDHAVIHQDGKVEVIGRIDRMIKVNGEQVILDDIEELINTLAFVEKSAVVKRTDSKRGFVPVAFIKVRQGYQYGDTQQQEILALYDQKLTAYARPRKTTVIGEFPVTAVGKVDFRALEKMAEAEKSQPEA
ncbi:MAG TPA: hypothetical protein DDX71_04495 [Ruminococcus sp.]|nr:hypothetical protein [Ruminococcus sp.]